MTKNITILNKVSNFPNSQTEEYFSSPDVDVGDSLTIYDGPNDQSTQIEKLSGYLESFNISSTGNSILAKFKSDDFQSEAGFLATIHYGNS